MQQKIIQIGNSTGIIIPKALLDKLEIQAGQEVEIEEDTTTNALFILKKGTKMNQTSISPRFLKILDKVNDEYSSALQTLANK